MSKEILECSMPGCECWASTKQLFVLHMKRRHGVTISVEDLEYLEAKQLGVKPSDPRREEIIKGIIYLTPVRESSII